ncbi:MAG: hypothetical protein ACTSRZ_01520 [Promethearchaeota archaeon]
MILINQTLYDFDLIIIGAGAAAFSVAMQANRYKLKTLLINEILRIHILSPLAADIIHEASMIIRNHMTLDDVISQIHVFPTLSESIKLACQSFKRDIKLMSCCSE